VEEPGAILGAGPAWSLDWSPQGDQLLLGCADGGLVALPVAASEAPRVLLDAAAAPTPGDAAWSPTGEAVAFRSPVDGTAPPNLFVASLAPAIAPPRPLLDVVAEDRAVTEFAWTADGRALLYADGPGPSGVAAGGDLWWIAEDGGERRLIASAGEAGPVAQVVGLRPSPDGRAVAFAYVVPGEGGPRFHSLWVVELASGRGFSIPVAPEQSVTGVWWTAAGLVYRTVPAAFFAGDARGAPFTLWVAQDATLPRPLFEVAPSGVATPVPAGTPSRATPVAPGRASPVATPVG
jgi:hypothetical protein